METTQLKVLYKTLDDIKHVENGIEFWYARELYPILGYTKWENFETAINRAKEACEKSEGDVHEHFPGVRKLIIVGKNTEQEIADIKLTRYACYLTALNGDPRKEEIAFAQAYFVTQTRKMEFIEQRMAELERISVREKLSLTEKEFAALVFSRGVDGRGLGEIRSFGDKALFGGKSTDDMKKKLGIAKVKPLADFLPDITLKAKDLATAMTSENTRRKDLQGKGKILQEHITSNSSVRGALVKTGIYPESLAPAEDVKKLVARHKKETKELQTRHKKELEKAKKTHGISQNKMLEW
jgi:DNA-damage-inducible protein D